MSITMSRLTQFIFQSLFIALISICSISSRPQQSIRIVEDLPIGTSIYTFSTNGCPTEMKTETYRFVDNQKNFNDFFLIDPYTGRVTSKKLIDREEFCHRRMCSCAQCEIILEVLCVYRGQIFFNDLSIIIDDLNDHAPTFPKSRLHLDVLENVPVGFLIPLDVAIDPDYGKNSVQEYQLFDETRTSNASVQAFQIVYSKKNDMLALRLVKELDREQCASLNYTLEVFDGGQPVARSTRLPIFINILDVNDRSPVFQHSDLRLILNESTFVNSLIAHIHATDEDEGVNGLISYTIVSIDPPSDSIFRIAEHTGHLYLNQSLDYEREKSYQLKIKAQDNGLQKSSTPAFINVQIIVEDDNDNPPTIAATFNSDSSVGVEHPPNTNIVRIRENLPNGTFLGHISLSDLDQGDNARLNWTFESFDSILIKTFADNDAFLMFTKRVFDREQQSQYEIYLNAWDHGQPILHSTFNFTLVILDDNDHRPEFDRPFYTIDLLENTPIDTIITQFIAHDADEQQTNNSRVEYRLENSDTFTLNSSTGELCLKKPLDRERKSTYHLKITAFDYGQPRSLSTTVDCQINLIDVNDHPPRFDRSEYTFYVKENWSSELPIGHLYATDLDKDFNRLVYRWDVPPLINQWPFELSTNGTLYLTATSGGLDYERQSSYQRDALAIDNGGLQARVPVTIHVLNRNDFCPELLLNSSVLFYNKDRKKNSYLIDLFDGDNDSCHVELLNFQDVLRLQLIARNQYLLDVYQHPEREYYIVQLRLSDLINDTNDRSCIRDIQLILTTGNNQTNQTMAIALAEEYLQSLQFTTRYKHSSFQLMIINMILISLIFVMAIFSALIAVKIFCSLSKRSHSIDSQTRTIYRFQGPTETQLPLLDQESPEQIVMMNSHRSMSLEDKSQTLDDHRFTSVHLRKLEKYPLDLTETMRNQYHPYSSSIDFHQRDSGYETKRSSSIIDHHPTFLPTNVSLSVEDQLLTVSYYSTTSTALPTFNNVSQTLKTFTNRRQSDSFDDTTATRRARLAEQESVDI